jgi:hypothetical protein
LSSEEWKDIYKPRADIDPIIYEPLMKPFTNQEIKRYLRQLPAKKAAGPSGITNEL